MKLKQSKFIYLAVVAVSTLSFLYLNTVGATDVGVSSALIPETIIEMPDAKLSKFLLKSLLDTVY